MNCVQLIGRLTRDPEVRYTSGEESMAIARFTLAIDRGIKSKDGEKKADFPSCIAFGKTAEVIERFCEKGKQIAVMGRIQTGSFEKDGHTVYTTDVIADRIELLGSKSDSTKAPKEDVPEGFARVDDDEGLPF